MIIRLLIDVPFNNNVGHNIQTRFKKGYVTILNLIRKINIKVTAITEPNDSDKYCQLLSPSVRTEVFMKIKSETFYDSAGLNLFFFKFSSHGGKIMEILNVHNTRNKYVHI